MNHSILTDQFDCILESLILDYQNPSLNLQDILTKNNIPYNRKTCMSMVEYMNRKNIKRPKSIYRRRYYLMNEDYFEKIDSENKAYLLGWIYSDGNVFKKNTSTMHISLQIEDGYILDLFRAELNTNKPLYIRKAPKPTHSDQAALTVHSDKMFNDLNKLGVVPAKSLILQFPTQKQVSDELLRHFLRGFFDGDGCICFTSGTGKSFNESKKFTLGFVGTLEMMVGIQQTFKEKLNVTSQLSFPDIYKGNTCVLKIAGATQITKCLEWFYKDSTYRLKRKYNKFLELLNQAFTQSKKNKTYHYIMNNEYLKSLINPELLKTNPLMLCTKCNEMKPLDNFYIVKSKYRTYPKSGCRKCASKLTTISGRLWRARKKLEKQNLNKNK